VGVAARALDAPDGAERCTVNARVCLCVGMSWCGCCDGVGRWHGAGVCGDWVVAQGRLSSPWTPTQSLQRSGGRQMDVRYKAQTWCGQ
jgi:hypothetical protein